MSDYISKSALIEALEKSMKENNHKSMIGYAEHIQEHRYLIHLVEKQPTLDEKEIIRKYAEQIIKKLEFESEWSEPTFDEDGFCNDDSWEMIWLDKAIEIVKEECGINE